MRIVKRESLSALLDLYVKQPLTYAQVGSTDGDLPVGYRHTRRRTHIGSGDDDFAAAARFVTSWEMHRRSGLSVATDGDAEQGRTVVLGLGGAGLLLVVPCRVVYTVDQPGRRGFAYGTLPDHLVQGEEAFLVTQDTDDAVWFEITAFSRPGAALVRWAGPIGRAIQAAATSRYERAVASALS